MPLVNVLEKIAADGNFYGIAATSGHSSICNVEGVSGTTPFPIHSVGKILSGVLMSEMLAQDIITEDDLTTPGIKLPPEIEAKLTAKPGVMEKLARTTIADAMQHKAGLGDYTENYLQHLREVRETRNSMNDAVDFIGENWKTDYSNDGLLLAGFALQHLYNQRNAQNLSYEEILNKLVIEPSKTKISMTAPADAHYKAGDEHLAKLPVTPAGGHYASADDLMKFGEHLFHRCKDSKFMDAVRKYGHEFYSAKRNRIEHGGYMEGATKADQGSTAEFGVSLDSGKTTVILMDRDASQDDAESGRLEQTYASKFYREIRDEIEAERSFVERLGLTKPDEKPRSFVEAMQAGKYGGIKSPGGAHEL